WAVWKDQAFGTTYEPIAFVYNKRLVKAEEVPKTHAELGKQLKEHPDRWKGKVTAYDPERSGIGFLLITQDSKLDPAFWETATTSASLQKELGQVLKPIPVGPDILDSLNQKKRLDFLKKWQQAIGTK